MNYSQKEFQIAFGWNHDFENHMQSLEIGENYFPARVICEEKQLYRIQFGFEQTMWAMVPGKLQFNAVSRFDFPAVGDWVMVEVPQGSDRALIRSILPRKSIMRRKQVGASSDEQLIATNIDYVFITTSLNQDLNHHRIERYLTLAWDSGAQPVILLTKSDLFQDDLDQLLEDLRDEFVGVDVHALRQDQFEQADFLKPYLCAGRTAVFVGSSGVGKSTLVNYLIGREANATQSIREDDAKGRHTTTSRTLYQCHFGGVVIDTPGMREIQFADHEEGLQDQFHDVESLFLNCKFSDCKHETEPGCAVQNALKSGDLSEDRWRHYQKLAREIRYQMRKMDKSLASEEKQIWKQRTIELRRHKQMKK